MVARSAKPELCVSVGSNLCTGPAGGSGVLAGEPQSSGIRYAPGGHRNGQLSDHVTIQAHRAREPSRFAGERLPSRRETTPECLSRGQSKPPMNMPNDSRNVHTLPQIGVEEEYQLVDPASGRLIPNCKQVMETIRATPKAEVQHELHLSQIEMAS